MLYCKKTCTIQPHLCNGDTEDCQHRLLLCTSTGRSCPAEQNSSRHQVIKRKPTLCCVPRILSQMMRLCSLRESRSRARASNSARVVNSEAYRNCFLGSCNKNTFDFQYKASRASLTVIFTLTYSFPEVRNRKRD